MKADKIQQPARIISLLLTLLIFSALLFQSLHAGHQDNCHQENCQTCILLQIISSDTKSFNITPGVTIQIFFTVNIILHILFSLLQSPETLVSQKVKLTI